MIGRAEPVVGAGPAEPERAVVLGCEIDALGMDETVARCRELIEGRRPAQQLSVNAAKLVAMRRDPRLREIAARADVVSADGTAVVWASRLLGRPLPERVAGIDLMSRLLGLAETFAYPVYFLGATDDVLERALVRIREAHPSLVVAGARNGYFSDAEEEDVRSEIRRSAPDLLFVAMSSPRKEVWADRNRLELGVPLIVGVGGSLDVWAGAAARAPLWMQRAGLEWLFRLLQEPRRLWRRYLVSNTLFLLLVAGELVRGRRMPGSRS